MAVQGCAGDFFDVFWGFRDPPPGGSKSDKKKHDFQSFKKRIQILVEPPALVSPRGPVCSPPGLGLSNYNPPPFRTSP